VGSRGEGEEEKVPASARGLREASAPVAVPSAEAAAERVALSVEEAQAVGEGVERSEALAKRVAVPASAVGVLALCREALGVALSQGSALPLANVGVGAKVREGSSVGEALALLPPPGEPVDLGVAEGSAVAECSRGESVGVGVERGGEAEGEEEADCAQLVAVADTEGQELALALRVGRGGEAVAASPVALPTEVCVPLEQALAVGGAGVGEAVREPVAVPEELTLPPQGCEGVDVGVDVAAPSSAGEGEGERVPG
jgi:hypothetical protein